MKQIITTTLTIAKPQRLALFLITLLFLPSTAWGQDLISIAGTDVSSTNENITGDNISGKVSFIVAEGNNTLTLDGATINGSINYSGTAPLTITLSGSNIITATEDNRSAITINNSNASLKFKGQGAAKITPNNNKAITSTQSVQLDGVNVYSTEDYQLLTNIDNLTNGQSIIISAGAPTGLYIGGAIITTNILNALYNGKANFIPASEGGYATLQLDKAAITGDIEWDMNNALKIQLTEANTIQGCIHSNKDVALSFTYPSGATNSTLTFGNSEGTQSAISGFTEVTFPEINSQEINKLSFDENVSYNTSDKALKNDKNEVVTSSHISYYYGLTIAGVAVTSANAEDITGNNTVTFNASTNTLIINNATIDGYIEYNSSNPLIIEFSGANKIGYQNPGYLTSNVTTTLTLKKGVGNCSLSFFNSSSGLNYSSISGFSSVELDNGVYVQSSDYCSYRSGAFKYQDGTLVKSLTFTTTPYYPLWIAGVQVNEGNIQGDGITGTVTYNATNSTLTLNSATINGSIKSSLNDLTIEVAGSSNTLTAILYEGSSTSSTLLIKTPSSSSTVNKLTLENSTGAVISGFSTVTLDGLFFSTPNYPSVTTSTNWTSSINKAIITNEYGITIGGVDVTTTNKDDVLNDEGTVKFTPADNTASPATPATLTLNGAKITGTVFWTNSAPLTIAINGTNSITTTGAYAIEGNNQDNTTLTIAKVSETGKCKLILSGSTVGSISGFKNSSDTYAGSGLVYYEDQEEYTATILSTLSGSGTSTDPYLIETPEDLKDFSFFVNKQIITNKYIKIANNIDCKDLEGFESIGSSYPFMGTLSGYGNTISNLTINSGLGFFGHISGGIVNDLNFYKLSVKGNSYATGGIASELSAGGQIDNCTLTECTIACLDNQYSPEVGGIVARLSGSTSTISNCVVYKSTINASTIYTGGSGPIGYAGGIVASYSSGTITNCHVKDGSKIINVNADGGSTLKTGALVGNMSSETTTSITSNFYYYDVTVETQLGSSDKETKSGYTPRGTSDNTEDPTGAMLYTKNVIIPISTDAGHVSIGSDYYYQVTSDDTNTTYSIAPDVEVVISVENADVEGSYTLDGAKTIELKPKEGSTGLYTFDMPNADVTFTVQEAAAVHFSEEGQIYASYYNAIKDVAVPMGMTAYIVTGASEDGTKVIVSPVSYIKKGVAVLIEKDKTTEVSETTDFSGNKLIYADNEVPVTTGSKLYVLYQNQFVKVTSGTQIPTGKNYLDLSTFTNAGTRGFYDIGGANDGTSALRGVVAEGTNGKSDAWYTLQGRRLSAKPTKSGLYLHNGAKVVIK